MPEDLAHPRHYTIVQEEKVRGQRIQLDNSEIYATVDPKSIIEISDKSRPRIVKKVRARRIIVTSVSSSDEKDLILTPLSFVKGGFTILRCTQSIPTMFFHQKLSNVIVAKRRLKLTLCSRRV